MSTAVVLNQAPHSTIEKGLAVLGNGGVTAADWGRNVINDLVRRADVISTMKGEGRLETLTLELLLDREVELVQRVCTLAQIPVMDSKVIQLAIEQTAAGTPFTDRQRVQPPGLTIEAGFNGLYRLNLERKAAGLPELKLWQTPNQEEWRNCHEAERFPAEAGVITLDLGNALRATDLVGRPFNLLQNEQEEWARHQGGDGLTSVEEMLYLWLRSILERELPLWEFGSVRCRNARGPDRSLTVHWYADSGFSVDSWNRDALYRVGAVPRKFQPLAA